MASQETGVYRASRLRDTVRGVRDARQYSDPAPAFHLADPFYSPMKHEEIRGPPRLGEQAVPQPGAIDHRSIRGRVMLDLGRRGPNAATL